MLLESSVFIYIGWTKCLLLIRDIFTDGFKQNVCYVFSNIGTSAMKQPISLQVAATMEVIIEKNIFPNAGNIQGNLIISLRM